MLLLLLAVSLLMNLLPFGALAEEAEETTETVEETQAQSDRDITSGSCGEGLTWVYEDGTLVISGSGEMEDGDPWSGHKNRIKRVVFTGGVTKVGARSFYEYNFLESVDFGDALVEIGEQAFYGCTELQVIHLPATFRTFGAECFRECVMLQKVYCEGGMPRFNSSCLWCGDYVAVFYRTNLVWPQDAVNQLMQNFGGKLGIMMGNYEDSVEAQLEEKEYGDETLPQIPEESAEAPTIPETQAVTEPPTVPETEAVEVVYITAPPTEEVLTADETEPRPTREETRPVWQEELPEEEPDELAGKSWIGIVMIAGVITFLILGALIFRGATKKGGRYGR